MSILNVFLNVLVVIVCLAVSGTFACIAVLVWKPGTRQPWYCKVGFTVAVCLATVFSVAALIVPSLEF